MSPIYSVAMVALLMDLALARPGYISTAPAVDYYARPRYTYNYGVSDPETGDMKQASEQREGDVVKGQYSLVEPDGSLRQVHYTADPINGFNAVVSKSPAVHPKPVGHVAKSAVLVKAVHRPAITVASPKAFAPAYVPSLAAHVPLEYDYDATSPYLSSSYYPNYIYPEHVPYDYNYY